MEPRPYQRAVPMLTELAMDLSPELLTLRRRGKWDDTAPEGAVARTVKCKSTDELIVSPSDMLRKLACPCFLQWGWTPKRSGDTSPPTGWKYVGQLVQADNCVTSCYSSLLLAHSFLINGGCTGPVPPVSWSLISPRTTELVCDTLIILPHLSTVHRVFRRAWLVS